MWISVSRIHILSILAVVFSTGCITTLDNASRHRQYYWDYEDHVDLSDSSAGGVVTIGGSTRTLLGLVGQYCWIVHEQRKHENYSKNVQFSPT